MFSKLQPVVVGVPGEEGVDGGFCFWRIQFRQPRGCCLGARGRLAAASWRHLKRPNFRFVSFRFSAAKVDSERLGRQIQRHNKHKQWGTGPQLCSPVLVGGLGGGIEIRSKQVGPSPAPLYARLACSHPPSGPSKPQVDGESRGFVSQAPPGPSN